MFHYPYPELRVSVPEGQSGSWKVERFTVVENDIQALRYALHGRPVPPGTYTRLRNTDGGWDATIVMADTPAEIEDNLRFLNMARGRVLVNGLGLGVVLKGLLSKPDVSSVDVVELEQDVINLVWPTYQVDPRLHLYHADAFTIKWPPDTSWHYIWHDIWPTICTDNLPKIARLKRKYAGRALWQGAWLETELRRLKRRGF